MGNEFDNFIRRMKEEDSASFDMDAKGRAVYIIADAIQRMRTEGLGSIDIAKSLSHAAALLAGHKDDWEWNGRTNRLCPSGPITPYQRRSAGPSAFRASVRSCRVAVLRPSSCASITRWIDRQDTKCLRLRRDRAVYGFEESASTIAL